MSRRGRGGRNRNHSRHGGGDRPQHQNNRADGRQNHRQDRQQTSSPTQQQPEARQGQAGKSTFQSAIQPRKTLSRPGKEPSIVPPQALKRYHVIFFDTLVQAKSDLENLRKMASECDQLNIVVRAEASMDDQDLTSVGKLFCGAAWSLIHERRKADGWYENTHE